MVTLPAKASTPETYLPAKAFTPETYLPAKASVALHLIVVGGNPTCGGSPAVGGG